MQSPQFLLTLALALLTSCIAVEGESERPAFALAIHGGAGTITRADLTPEMEAAYLEALEAALRSGHAVLASGGSSVDAVVATLELMERSVLFNAGVGAVFTNAGECELDASIMDGALHQAGAVAGVRTTSSPIRLAREVMRHSPHVMLAGSGADSWAAERGLEQVDNEHFHTARRREQLERVQRDQQAGLATRTSDRVGTVGCVQGRDLVLCAAFWTAPEEERSFPSAAARAVAPGTSPLAIRRTAWVGPPGIWAAGSPSGAVPSP